MIQFFVSGEPKTLSVGTTIRAGNRVFQVRRGSEWSDLVGETGSLSAPGSPMSGPIDLTAMFYVTRPKSSKGVEWPLKRPDIDNLAHKLSDQWNESFYQDDSQIVNMMTGKRFAGERGPGVEITVRESSHRRCPGCGLDQKEID